MSRNVTILVIVLVILLIAGYLVWIRQRFQVPQAQTTLISVEEIMSPTPSVIPTRVVVASPSAAPNTATSSAKADKTVLTPTPVGDVPGGLLNE